MGVALTYALIQVQDAAKLLFDADPATRSVGVGRNGDGFGYVAVRNAKVPVAFGAALGQGVPHSPPAVLGVPVHYYFNSGADPASLVRVPHTGPGSPGISERRRSGPQGGS